MAYQGTKVTMATDFFSETASQQWNTFKFCFESKKIYQLRILYPVKIPFKNAGEVKTFSDMQKLKEFQEISKDLQAEGEVIRGKEPRTGAESV